MKNIFSIIFVVFSLFSKNTIGQFAIAGIHGSIYVDIVPDISINSAPNSSNSYNLDINQDGNDDIKISTSFIVSGGVTEESVDVSALNSFTKFFSGGYFDSTKCQSSANWTVYVSSIFKIYVYDDTIEGGVTNTSGKLAYYYSYLSGSPGNYCSTSWQEWAHNNSEKYLGVIYGTTIDTSYGWVHLAAGGSSCTIKEFSLGVPLIDIKETRLTNNSIIVFPNPVTNSLRVIAKQLVQIKITDVLGNDVFQVSDLSSSTSQINMSNFPDGIYFVSIKTTGGTNSQKIVIQH